MNGLRKKEKQKTIDPLEYWVIVDPKTSRVMSVHQDISALWPINADVYSVTSLPDNFDIRMGYIYNGQIVPDMELLKAKKLLQLDAVYLEGVGDSVLFTPSILKKEYSFQADKKSFEAMSSALSGFTPKGAVPENYYWKSSDNFNVPFTFDDLVKLTGIVSDLRWAAFSKLQQLKSYVASAKNQQDLDIIK